MQRGVHELGKQLDDTYFPSPKARVNTAKRRKPAADQKTMKRAFVHSDRVSGRDKDCGRRRIKEQPSRSTVDTRP